MDREPAQAAVLMGLVKRDDPPVLLTQRTDHKSTHAAQVPFAGGKADGPLEHASTTRLSDTTAEGGLYRP